MPYETALKYYRAVEIIDARERLMELNVASYPMMKKDGRNRYYKKLHKTAYPVHLQKPMDFDDFFKKMGKA